MAESHKSNGNDVIYLVITTGVVAVWIVALYHSWGLITTMAESHKSNGNDVFYLVVVSAVVAVWCVALCHCGCTKQHLQRWQKAEQDGTNEYEIFYDYDQKRLSNRKSETIPTTMAESNKSNGNDVFYLVVVSGVVAVWFVALCHSWGLTGYGAFLWWTVTRFSESSRMPSSYLVFSLFNSQNFHARSNTL